MAAHRIAAADAGDLVSNTTTGDGSGVAGVSVSSGPDTAGVQVQAASAPPSVAPTGNDVAGELRLAGLLLALGALSLAGGRRRSRGRHHAA